MLAEQSSPATLLSNKPPPPQQQQQQQQQQQPPAQRRMQNSNAPILTYRVLSAAAVRCHAYAKALRIKEKEYKLSLRNVTHSGKIIEDLITINNELQLPDSARGVLLQAQKTHAVQLHESWYEKLDRWSDALAVYRRKLEESPSNTEALLGTLRCLNAMGEYGEMKTYVMRGWHGVYPETKVELAPYASSASMSLGEWDLLEKYIEFLPEGSIMLPLFRAVLEITKGNYREADMLIMRCRSVLDSEIAPLINESYTRAYPHFVRAQELAELEEVMRYHSAESDEERQQIMAVFERRLRGVTASVDTWQPLLRVQELAINPHLYPKMWVKFVGLCRRRGRITLARSTLEKLADRPLTDRTGLLTVTPPEVAFAVAKVQWSSARNAIEYRAAFSFLCQLREQLTVAAAVSTSSPTFDFPPSTQRESDDGKVNKLLARIHLKIASWQLEINHMEGRPLTQESIDNVMVSFQAAVRNNSTAYKTWHAWAMANAEYVKLFPRQAPEHHIVVALDALVHSVAASGTGSAVQDVLTLLNLAFGHCDSKRVEDVVRSSIGYLDVSVWLTVIPQIMARIGSRNTRLAKLAQELLTRIGVVHPQAVVYPLNVALKSPASDNSFMAARAVFDSIRPVAKRLESQVVTLSRELVKLGIFWHEMWAFGINEASKLCYDYADFNGMWKIFYVMYGYLTRQPKTVPDLNFKNMFQTTLIESLSFILQYKKTKDFNHLQAAWDRWFAVFKAVEVLNNETTSIDLAVMMPDLLALKDLQLCVPGTYRVHKPLVRIASIRRQVKVLKSKQRPRTVTIVGSNGVEYQFLLKGHEDLRQDERAMQFFALCNTLLKKDEECARDHLRIVTYSVVPLSPNAGLIGWVLHSDTFHMLVKEYRDWKGIPVNRETMIMKEFSPNYELLTLAQKVELFLEVLAETDGMDMRNILWRRSPNTEVWLRRRLEFTRSLAVMSMVGHILGIGDRHPSNLMMDRDTGYVIHIDFGDCFETAIFRAMYPERIPFRLTRMLINVMEVSGIEGTFRATCERVMTLLRANKDSLLTVLETFVYDPLLTWKLVEDSTSNGQQMVSSKSHPLNGYVPEESIRSIREGMNRDEFMLHVGETPQSGLFRSSHTGAGLGEKAPKMTRLQAAAERNDPYAQFLISIGPELNEVDQQPHHHHHHHHQQQQQQAAPAASSQGDLQAQKMDSGDEASKNSFQPGASSADGVTAKAQNETDALNSKALRVMKRVIKKLEGREFGQPLNVQAQVDRLFVQATSEENLAACYRGWCPFW